MLLDNNFRLLDYYDFTENKLSLSNYFDLKQGSQILSQGFIESLPFDIDKFRKFITRAFERGSEKIIFRIMPSTVAEVNYGYIILWQSVKELAEPDYIALENASMVFAMERIRIKEIEEVKTRLKSDYFDDLITGKITSVKNVENQFSLLGINPEHQHYCMVLSCEMKEEESFDDIIKAQYAFEGKAKSIMRIIQNSAFSEKQSAVCFLRSNNIVALIGMNKSLPEFTAADTKEFANDIYSEICMKFSGSSIKIGIGGVCSSISDLKFSFAGACSAIRYGEKFSRSASVFHSDDFLIYEFLEDNIGIAEMSAFFTKVLGDLYDADKRNNTNYLETLESYLANNYNATEAARKLYVHRNTFLHRIEKIKKILNTDLNESDELLNYSLAIKIHKLIN